MLIAPVVAVPLDDPPPDVALDPDPDPVAVPLDESAPEDTLDPDPVEVPVIEPVPDEPTPEKTLDTDPDPLAVRDVGTLVEELVARPGHDVIERGDSVTGRQPSGNTPSKTAVIRVPVAQKDAAWFVKLVLSHSRNVPILKAVFIDPRAELGEKSTFLTFGFVEYCPEPSNSC